MHLLQHCVVYIHVQTLIVSKHQLLHNMSNTAMVLVEASNDSLLIH